MTFVIYITVGVALVGIAPPVRAPSAVSGSETTLAMVRSSTIEGVPANAAVFRPSDQVTLYHWRVEDPRLAVSQIHAHVEIGSWPKGVWGAEILLTPLPHCCGAKEVSWRLRKSEKLAPRLLGEIDRGSQYRLRFQFR